MAYIVIRKVIFSLVVSFVVSLFIRKKNIIMNIALPFAFCSFFELGVFLCRVLRTWASGHIIMKTLFTNTIVQTVLGYYAAPIFILLYLFLSCMAALALYAYELRSKRKFALYSAICCIGFASVVYGFSNKIEISNFTICIANLPQGLKGAKIVHISDLHDTVYANNQESLINMIIEEKPDLIFLTGDMVECTVSTEGTKLLLEGIRELAPIYYVPGNHEYWSDYYFDILDELETFGVIILEDNMNKIIINNEEIYVFGFDDPDCYLYKSDSPSVEARFDMLANQADERNVNLLLSHRPELHYLYEGSPFDIVFSGHAHGGQARIPFTEIAAIAPDQGFFPEYTNGVYNLTQGNAMVVSRGLSISEKLPRVYNRPHLVTVTLD